MNFDLDSMAVSPNEAQVTAPPTVWAIKWLATLSTLSKSKPIEVFCRSLLSITLLEEPTALRGQAQLVVGEYQLENAVNWRPSRAVHQPGRDCSSLRRYVYGMKSVCVLFRCIRTVQPVFYRMRRLINKYFFVSQSLHYTASLIPRSLPPPVSDCLQCENNRGMPGRYNLSVNYVH